MRSKKKAKPEDSEAEVQFIRQTRSGNVLVELGAKTKNKEAFRGIIDGILGEKAVISGFKPRCSIEIRDLDCLIDKEEVKKDFRRDVPDLGKLRIGFTPENRKGQRIAIVNLGEKAASKLLIQGKIRIGWVYGGLKQRDIIPHCYKCLRYGHLSKSCHGPDRSNSCFTCWQQGHIAKDCSAPVFCDLCKDVLLDPVEVAHIPASGACNIFRDTLEKTKKALK